jgi:uncharacterized protein YjbI with pentapeptide repeats
MKNLIVGIAFLFAANVAFAQGIAQDVDTLETDVDVLESNVVALDSDVSALEGQVAALQTENAQLEAVIESLTAVVDGLVAQQADLVALQRCHAIGGSLGWSEDENGTLGVNWRGCNKRRLNMVGPGFGGSEMTALLVNADLRNTDFTGAYLLGVFMGGSNVAGANFTDANLTGSNLQGANIVTWQQAQDYAHLGLEETIFNNTICPDGTNSDTVGGTCANNRTP